MMDTSARRAFGSFALLLVACTSSSSSNTPPGGSVDGGGGGDAGTIGKLNPSLLESGGDCAKPTGPGTAHDSNVTVDEVWTAAASPHTIGANMRVKAKVRVEACAVVQIKPGVVVSIGDSADPQGTFITEGRFDEASNKVYPVVIESADPTKFFGGIYVYPTSKLDLTITAVVRGGNADSAPGAIEARGTQAKPLSQNLRMRGVLVTKSGASGVVLSSYAGFTSDSEALYVTESGQQPESDPRLFTGFPIDIQPPGMATLPRGGAYTGNRRDEIFVRAATRVDVDETFPSLGVPFRMHGTFQMYDLQKSPLTLTIEAGATLRFEKEGSGSMRVAAGDFAAQAPVKVVAKGTSASHVTLTSAEPTPAAGDWGGLSLLNSPGSVLEYVDFSYAGGESGTRGFGCGPMDNDSALLIQDWVPADAFVKNCTFNHIRGSGITAGFKGAAPDLVSTNTFADIQGIPQDGKCDVTQPMDANGACSGTRPMCAQ
jgi:hypothetical protein